MSLSDLVLSIADNKQMLGLRYAEWATRAPSLEADIAAAAMGLDDLGHILERRVDEHADDLEAPLECRPDLGRRVEFAAPRRARVEDQPDRPGARGGGALGVGQVGHPAELDLRVHTHIVGG